MTSRRMRSGFALLLVAALAACGVEKAADRAAAPVVGAAAPAFGATTLEGDTIHLAALRGQPVLLNIWATWCPPCRREMPALQHLSDSYAANGLRVLGVSIDQAGDEGLVRDFIHDNHIRFTILLDPDASATRIFRTAGVPETVLIDRDGVIRKMWIGAIDPASPSVRTAVEQVVAGRQS